MPIVFSIRILVQYMGCAYTKRKVVYCENPLFYLERDRYFSQEMPFEKVAPVWNYFSDKKNEVNLIRIK